MVSLINLHLLRTQYQVQIMSTEVDIIAHEEEQPRNCQRPWIGGSTTLFFSIVNLGIDGEYLHFITKLS